MKYSIVIPTYNHCNDLLKPCIESILKYSNVSDIELIVSANGCKDETFAYLGALKEKFVYLGLDDNLKITWAHEPLGYAKATNEGIKLATTDLIILLNNDTVLLHQPKNTWLEILAAQFQHPNCGISCLIKGPSEPAGHDFAVFFCVMVHRKVFDKIGLLSLDYGVGGGEDTEFSIECEKAGFEVREAVVKTFSNEVNMYVGDFPIYHKGEGTVHDKELVPEWEDIFLTNSITLSKKYNPAWYKWHLSNNWERAVYFKGDQVAAREATRYTWAAQNLIGNKVFELGCTSGYGVQFFPNNIDYTGLDYDKRIVKVAYDQEWGSHAKFVHGDINQYTLDFYDTIIAFEVIEHIANGLEVVERLKKHCNRLLITVPMLEPPGHWGPHHLLHNLDESFFPGFEFKYISPAGLILDQPEKRGDLENINLMLCKWDRNAVVDNVVLPVQTKEVKPSEQFSFLREQNEYIYREVITDNAYRMSKSHFANGEEVIDIGANIGAFSLLAASLGASQVVSVEPVSATHQLLCNNISRSGYKNIFPIKNLVSSVSGQSYQVSIKEDNGHNSMYNVNDTFEVVSTITLKDIIRHMQTNNIILKLDCEGAEYDIIMTADPVDMARISRVLLEIHSELHPTYKGFDIIENKLRAFGFKQYSMEQVHTWIVGPNGEQLNMKPAPFRVELWER